LPSTNVTVVGTPSIPDDVAAARASVPNDDDEVISPTAAACHMCHDSTAVITHMEQNGAAVYWPRIDYETIMPVETCEVCHGPGSIADVDLAHGLLD
jgi:OmcA/MtrC family decaheme c-type cytochrome